MSKLKNIFFDSYGLRVGWIITTFLGCVFGLFFVGTLTFRQFDYHYTSTYCQPKLNAINRTGKFVEYNFWDYQCLASVGDKYVPLDQIYNNLQVQVSK